MRGPGRLHDEASWDIDQPRMPKISATPSADSEFFRQTSIPCPLPSVPQENRFYQAPSVREPVYKFFPSVHQLRGTLHSSVDRHIEREDACSAPNVRLSLKAPAGSSPLFPGRMGFSQQPSRNISSAFSCPHYMPRSSLSSVHPAVTPNLHNIFSPLAQQNTLFPNPPWLHLMPFRPADTYSLRNSSSKPLDIGCLTSTLHSASAAPRRSPVICKNYFLMEKSPKVSKKQPQEVLAQVKSEVYSEGDCMPLDDEPEEDAKDEDFILTSDEDDASQSAYYTEDSDSDYTTTRRSKKKGKVRAQSHNLYQKKKVISAGKFLDSGQDVWPASFRNTQSGHRRSVRKILTLKKQRIRDQKFYGSTSSDEESSLSTSKELYDELNENARRSQRSRQRRNRSGSGFFDVETDNSSVEDNFSIDHDDDDRIFIKDRNSEVSAQPFPYYLGVDRILGYKAGDTKRDFSFIPNLNCVHDTILVKWNSLCHLHNTWESISYLQEIKVTGLRKVENFLKKTQLIAEQRSTMTYDEIEQQDISFELQKQLDLDALTPERIVASKIDVVPYPSKMERDFVETNKGNMPKDWKETEIVKDGERNLSSSSKQKEDDNSEISPVISIESSSSLLYFIKWTNCPYHQCTWETEQFFRKNGFEDLILSYQKLEDRVTGPLSAHLPLHKHALSRTSFEPYTETPWFIYNDTGWNACSLRDYQLYGKTVQTITTIGHIIYNELIPGPFLIIVPQSTVDNWHSEFKKWLPDVNVVVYHGNPVAREIIRSYELCIVEAAAYKGPPTNKTDVIGYRIPAPGNRSRLRCDVCIVTLSILTTTEDLEFLRSISWYFMVTDEAHVLKNRNSCRFRELNQFDSRYRLLLSGTPLHNNLEEMWSLLHFLNPVVYDDFSAFKRKYSDVENIDSIGERKEIQLASLQTELNEIVLRRVKKDVEKSLPNKIERILRIELSPKQVLCCEAVLSRNYETLAKTSGVSKTSLQNICMELKKLQSDAQLSNAENDFFLSGQSKIDWQKDLIHSSGKLAFLDKFLPHLKEKGHRVLIFSQMVRMLNILSKYLTIRRFKHQMKTEFQISDMRQQRLDGTMSREVRDKAMEHFNDPNSDDFCFLLSTKAGGLGINLTSADTVIIYDSDWNPQNDIQAEARAHRIGQTKTVHIYRLVTRDTIEERILERAKAKMVLDTLVIQSLNQRHSPESKMVGRLPESLQQLHANRFGFSKEELNKILKFGATKLWKAQNQNVSTNGKIVNEDMISVDLNKILAEAEQHESTSLGIADALVSSFSNISDFKYEAPEDEPLLQDTKFWEKKIPEASRIQYQKQTNEITAVTRTRKYVMKAEKKQLLDDEDFQFSSPSSTTDGSLNGQKKFSVQRKGNSKREAKKKKEINRLGTSAARDKFQNGLNASNKKITKRRSTTEDKKLAKVTSGESGKKNKAEEPKPKRRKK